MRTVLKDNFPKYHANISLDSAQAVILHNVYSKFSDYFKNIEVKVEEDGRMTFTGLLKYPNKPAVFERYENPFEKRSIPTRDEILNNNGINFSNGLFMAELLCLASNREMTIKYMGDNATVQIL